MSYAEIGGQIMAVTRVRRAAVWDTVQFAANGVIFVLLGEQMPAIIAGAAQTVRETGHREPIWLVVYIIAINVGLAAVALRLDLRFAAADAVQCTTARGQHRHQGPDLACDLGDLGRRRARCRSRWPAS